MRLPIAVLFASLVLTALPAAAQTDLAASPYEGRAPVADQSDVARDSGLRNALAEVIERVSGPGSSANAAAIIAGAPQLVQRYAYDNGNGGLQLVASFDKTAVDRQLRAAGLPVWGISSAPAQNTDLVVSGLRGSADYARTLSALRAVPGVRRVAVLGADADHLSLAVDAEGGAARLVGALGNGPQFVRDPNAAPGTLGLRLVR
ncbi:DUF2066 domain-containing protein [Solimonas terrae]|uniref:DUF2066 domain-containing protein n=1 Tax=Solimonas terrae TaxID=1396819 RepID=A0A6M2BRE2_9GAMM|nr:DUF2066 domain-containing protein [Solimonas terrae]NGY04673.1 DUF2066 domain-containing protein [Solimonas terrae]